MHVTVQGRDPGRKPGVRVHQVRALARREIRVLNQIPVTAPARTLLDLAAELAARDLEQCIAEAYARRLARESDLRAVLRLQARHRGAAALRAWVGSDVAPALTRSEAEERLLDLIRKAGLPAPEVNVRIGPHEVDFLWRAERLVVEVDGFQFHSSRASFERDRLRDAELQAQGFRVIRVTWRQLVDQPEGLLARIAQALALVR
jgi:very-short-patch-repair endonuclease